MTVKEFEEQLSILRESHPDIDDMEIGPVFSSGTIMMVCSITLETKSGWDGKDAIGINWHC
jgi:hypothetical protein